MTQLPMPTPAATALADFVDRHRRGLMRWLVALGADTASAEDHCQEALLAGLHHEIHGWSSKRAWKWLRTTARNFYLMQLRREKRRPTHPFDDVEQAWLAASGDDDGGDQALDALRQCLDAADKRDRELLNRRYADEQSRQQIGDSLGIGDAGVKQALRRARARLRNCMEYRLEDAR